MSTSPDHLNAGTPIRASDGFIGLPRSWRKRVLILVRMLAGGVLVAAALATPGFLSATSLLSLLTTMSFVGCVAAGMTFITLSGNVMSFCLGATLSATTIVFMACLPVGLAGALVLAFLFSAVLTGAQGWVVGYFRANPRPVRYQPAKRDKRSLNQCAGEKRPVRWWKRPDRLGRGRLIQINAV